MTENLKEEEEEEKGKVMITFLRWLILSIPRYVFCVCLHVCTRLCMCPYVRVEWLCTASLTASDTLRLFVTAQREDNNTHEYCVDCNPLSKEDTFHHHTVCVLTMRTPHWEQFSIIVLIRGAPTVYKPSGGGAHIASEVLWWRSSHKPYIIEFQNGLVVASYSGCWARIYISTVLRHQGVDGRC